MLRAKFLAKFAICPLYRDSPLLGNAMGHTGSVLDIPRQLAASSVDVITPGFANGGHKTRLNQHTGKLKGLNGIKLNLQRKPWAACL